MRGARYFARLCGLRNYPLTPRGVYLYRRAGDICGVPEAYQKMHPGVPASAGFPKTCAGALRAQASKAKSKQP
eukprot:1818217-Prymnesium_polylepis.1